MNENTPPNRSEDASAAEKPNVEQASSARDSAISAIQVRTSVHTNVCRDGSLE